MKIPLFIFFLLISKVAASTSYSFNDFILQKEITNKSKIAVILWEKYLGENIDSLKNLGDILLIQAFENKNEFAIAVGKRCLGSFFIRNGKQDKGIKLLNESNIILNKLKDYELISDNYNEIGNGYNLLGQPKKAIIWYNKSIKTGAKSSNPTSRFTAEINVGKALTDLQQYDDAENIIKSYISKCKGFNKYSSIANGYSRLGIIYQMRGNFPMAIFYFKKSNEINLKFGSKIQASHTLNNLAIIFYEENKTDSCMIYFEKALKIRKDCANWKGVAESYYNLGELYYGLGENVNALKNYTLSKNIAKEKNLLNEQIDALSAIIEINKEQKNTSNLIELMDEYIQLKNNQIDFDNVELQNNFTTEKQLQEKEDHYNRIIRENILFNKIRSEKSNHFFIYSVCFILLSLFSAYLIVNSRQKKIN